ncbi:MAG: DUF2530 domain-containing protein [Pseudonocardiaceae bacterium]
MAEAPDIPERKALPELPKSLVDVIPAATVGTVLWLAALAVLLVLQFALDQEVGGWMATSLAGVALGLIGLSIAAWQRRASRRGARGAQRNL